MRLEQPSGDRGQGFSPSACFTISRASLRMAWSCVNSQRIPWRDTPSFRISKEPDLNSDGESSEDLKKSAGGLITTATRVRPCEYEQGPSYVLV